VKFQPFLRTLTTEQLKDSLRGFNRRFHRDWTCWVAESQHGLTAPATVSLFQATLKSWNPCRGPKGGVRRSVGSAIECTLPHLRALSGVSLRSFVDPSPQQCERILQLWNVLNPSICCNTDAGGVGVSKAIMLLTNGEIGPALDGNVRGAFGMSIINSADDLVRAYSAIATDLRDFEDWNDITVEDLARQVYPSDCIAVGRIVDMIGGPRERA